MSSLNSNNCPHCDGFEETDQVGEHHDWAGVMISFLNECLHRFLRGSGIHDVIDL